MAAGGAAGVAGGTLAAGPRFGVRSMSAPLRRVLVRRPSVTGDFAAAGWRAPEAGLLAGQHEAFGQLLTDLGCEVEVAPAASGLVDATYVRDPGLVTGAGAVLFQMVKPARWAGPRGRTAATSSGWTSAPCWLAAATAPTPRACASWPRSWRPRAPAWCQSTSHTTAGRGTCCT